MAFPERVFCDTSFFYACLDSKDANHARAGVLVTESASAGTALYTTWDIVSETATLLRYRRNFQEEAEQIFTTYGRDHRLSFCDAISFVVVTMLLDHSPCFTFDEDFRRLGLTVLP